MLGPGRVAGVQQKLNRLRHGLIGVRFLRDVVHAGGVICALVTHLSGAMAETDERSLSADLESEFLRAA